MTTQALPSFDTTLADQIQHTKNAQALADQYKQQLDITRDALHELQASYAHAIQRTEATIAALERRLAETQQGLTVAEGG